MNVNYLPRTKTFIIMDYKVKYEQAIADARAIIKDYKERHLDDIAKRSEEDFSAVFHELKESEDEKIRKGLIDFVNQYGDNFYGQISKEYAIAWIEKQGEMDMESYKAAEDEKREFVGDGFVKCYADFQDFKEGQTYWLEYVGNDDYNVRSDNLLGITYHITPCQLYTIFKKMTWLEKQGEQILANSAKTCKVDQKPNPYSGTSFDYDGHTWGMCARDNGVELLLDGELKAFLSLEKSFIYPIHPQPELAPKSALEAAKEEKVDNANKVEPKDYNDIDPHFGKPIDKVVPKFKVGDWVVYCGKTCKITGLQNGIFTITNQDGSYFFNRVKSTTEPDFHLWNIADAKDGDVLVASDGSIFLFAGVVDCACKYYVALTACNDVKINKEVDGGYWETSRAVHPATKEQRDTLFSKMKEEGYVWLSGKKRLVKLLFKEGDTVRKKLDGSIWHINYINENGYWGNHKPLFPIENQNEFELVEKKPEWSEEDEKIIQWIATDIKRLINDNKKANIIADQEIKWLESLRPRSQWKPSDEQIMALRWVLNHIPYDSHKEEISGLLEQLKKLREE